MSMVGHIVFYYIPSAWASALLILYQGQCESLTRGISKVADSRALFICTLTLSEVFLGNQRLLNSCARHVSGIYYEYQYTGTESYSKGQHQKLRPF